MDYVLEPSLEHVALTRIAVSMWNQECATTEADLPSLGLYRRLKKVWLEAEDKLIGKVTWLPLPEPLKRKVLKFISGIGWEIRKCGRHLEKYNLDIVLPSELCWTPHGTVNTKKTAEALIKNENIDVARRYRLACEYCLEDDISKLWDKIPENLREQFYTRKWPHCEYLMMHWTHRIKEEMNKLDDEIQRKWRVRNRSPYQYAFEYAASCGNKAATEYFLQRLTHQERKVSLVTSAKIVACMCSHPLPSYFPNVLCFLFSQMDEFEKIEVFKDDPQLVLYSLLEWRWQSFFMETVNRMGGILTEQHLHRLLTIMIFRAKITQRDCDYRKFFVQLWQQSPNAHKKYIIDQLKTGDYFLLALFANADKEIIGLILNGVTYEERKDIILSPRGILVCENLVHTDKWDTLNLFFQAFRSSKEVMIEFKEKIKEWKLAREMSEKPVKHAGKEYNWDKFFQILEDLIQDHNNKKHAVEAGESTSAKKFRGTEFEDATHDMKIDSEE